MNKKVYLPFLMLTLTSTLAAASQCDDSILSITNLGGDRYQYSIEMSAGTIGQKDGGGITKINKQPSSKVMMYRLFSGKGTHGNISGKVFLQDMLSFSPSIVTVPFTFTSGPLSCHIHPKSDTYNEFAFQVHAHKARNHILDLKLAPYGGGF